MVYVVLLLLSVLYRFANSRGFTGDPITLRPGVPTSNNISKRSETHYITLHSKLLVSIAVGLLLPLVGLLLISSPPGESSVEGPRFVALVVLGARAWFESCPLEMRGSLARWIEAIDLLVMRRWQAEWCNRLSRRCDGFRVVPSDSRCFDGLPWRSLS